MNKTVEDLKMEIEEIKKTQTEGILEIEQTQAKPTEYKRWKRESQTYKIQ